MATRTGFIRYEPNTSWEEPSQPHHHSRPRSQVRRPATSSPGGELELRSLSDRRRTWTPVSAEPFQYRFSTIHASYSFVATEAVGARPKPNRKLRCSRSVCVAAAGGAAAERVTWHGALHRCVNYRSAEPLPDSGAQGIHFRPSSRSGTAAAMIDALSRLLPRRLTCAVTAPQLQPRSLNRTGSSTSARSPIGCGALFCREES
jgi:hypothetical protein